MQKDLVVLVADANMEAAVKGLLSRPESLGIRAIDAEILRHPERDPGCFLRAPDFLRSIQARFRHALAMLDREGTGREEMSRIEMEDDLGARLSADWGSRSAALVLDPELEVWLWSDSPHVEALLGWKEREQSLASWLVESGYLIEGASKPDPPKEAVQKALRIARKPRSSALYRRLAERVSLNRCEDPTFHRFRDILQLWFPLLRH